MISSLKLHRQIILALALILLVAAALRLVELGQVPFGLYHDEAVNGLDIWNVLTGQRTPLFFEANGGREPLFIYLQALSVALFGPSAWALRIVSAIVAILTLALFFPLARELTPPEWNPEALALVATAGLATSYWHLQWSRIGLRAILLPLVLCLTFYFFLVARRTQGTRYALLAGLFLGLAMYTYLAARLIPLIYLAFLVLDWTRTRKMLRQNALLVAAAFVVALPLGIYFLQRPDAFASRTGDIALNPFASTFPIDLAQNAVRVVEMFFWQGDAEWRHGISLRPVLDPIAALLFAVGLLFSAAHWRTATVRLAWLWLAVMLLPTLLSEEAPDTLRAIGAAPIVFWFVGAGWAGIRRWLTARLRQPRAAWTAAGVLLLLVGSGFFTVRDYFWVWGNDPRTYRDFDGEFAEIAAWANGQPGNVYLPLPVYANPTVQFLTLARAPELASIVSGSPPTAQQGGTVLLNSAADSKQQYVLLQNREAIPFVPEISNLLQQTGTLIGRYRALAATANTQAPPFVITATPEYVPLDAKFDGLNLAGYRWDSLNIEPGKPLGLTLFWERVGPVPLDPRVFVEIVDSKGERITRADKFPTDGISVARYPLGQIIPDRYLVAIENELAPGGYTPIVGLFDVLNGERWNVKVNGAVRDQVELRPLRAPPEQVSIPADAHQVSAQWENGITLEAYTVDTNTLTAGDTSEWTLYWETTQPVTVNLTVFVQLVDAKGTIIAQADHDPMQGAYPTALWQVGENVPDSFTLAAPPELPGGGYTLNIGWYDRATNQRVKLQAPQSANDAFPMQTWTIP